MDEVHDSVIQIHEAASQEALESVRALFQEYWTSFGFTPCFQNFDVELTALPGKYAPPHGRLLLATVNGEPAGCVALRRFDQTRGEVKRLYVRPQFRGSGLGTALMNALAAEARVIGYSELIADTIPKAMATALAMYERLGFERIAPYSDETPEAQHIRLRLRP
jgi:GNAT superfamily N-acetyltransferase